MVIKAVTVAARVERFIESVAVKASRSGDSADFSHRPPGHIGNHPLGKTVTLEPWDLAVLSQGGGRISRLGAASAAASTSVFLATLPS